MAPRPLQLLGAPTNLGLKHYDDGTPRRVDEAPAVLRGLGLVDRLAARDLGDTPAAPYRDLTRDGIEIRNASLIAEHAVRLADAVARAAEPEAQLVVLGGDCSILLGTMLGLRKHGRFGLVFVDGHCDFALPSFSRSGGAAGMDLALAVGRGGHQLARLAPDGPLVGEEDVVTLARKDLDDEPYYGAHSIRQSRVHDVPLELMRARGIAAVADDAIERVTRGALDGFWVHFDADALRPDLMAAVDSPEPDGLSLPEAELLLARLLAHPRARGIQVTIYDPGLDPERIYGRRLVDLLASALHRSPSGGGPP